MECKLTHNTMASDDAAEFHHKAEANVFVGEAVTAETKTNEETTTSNQWQCDCKAADSYFIGHIQCTDDINADN